MYFINVGIVGLKSHVVCWMDKPQLRGSANRTTSGGYRRRHRHVIGVAAAARTSGDEATGGAS